MSKLRYIVITVVAVLLASIVTFQITFVSQELKYQEELDRFVSAYSKYSKIFELDSVFRSKYIGEIDEEELLDYLSLGYVYGTGDKYAGYFTKEEYDELTSTIEGDFVGVGVLVVPGEGYIEIVNVMPDSPALEAGVQIGDIIVFVGDEYVADLGYQLALKRMLGDVGTDCVFTVLRGEEQIEFSITRDVIVEQSVMSRYYEPDPTIGVIKILDFNARTPEQFKSACESLIAGGAEKLIFDVRYNPGGELSAVCSVLDYLLPSGPIVRIADAYGNMEAVSSDESELDVPMCVLVNARSASAAELFASALQDYKKATLVGTTTYGKGTVQGMVRLSDGSGVTVSHSMYYPPFSDCYEGIGVIPDIECEMDPSLAGINIYKIADADDTQLTRAAEVLSTATQAEDNTSGQ